MNVNALIVKQLKAFEVICMAKKLIQLNLKEAKLALKGVADLPWSDAGSDLCSKLEKFIESCKKKKSNPS